MEPASPRYDRPPLSLIEARLPGYSADLYVGGMEAAGDRKLLAAHDITTVVNCAVNLDLNYAEPLPEYGDTVIFGRGAVRYYKIGLVDGHGNPATMMLAGFYILRGAMSQEMPDRPSYHPQARGNVLVNCRAGRSRSVALAALFLRIEMPDRFSTLDAALQHVRIRRDLRPDEWFETPKPMLVEAARQAERWIAGIEGDLAGAGAPASAAASGD
jgi:protein-tyrosine phosphatase